MIYIYILLGIINIFSYRVVATTNNFPIIGIFTQPTTSSDSGCNGDCLYLAASYVKYIESSGARVVPINYYATNEELDSLLGNLNGVLFPGGGAAFPSSAQHVYDKVVEMNDNGDFFPLWGTCMGFQWLLIAQSNDVTILDPPSGQLDSYNYSIPLDFTSTYKESNIFDKAPDTIVNILATQNVTMNNHHYGIFPDHFDSTPALKDFFHVLSTNKDRQGVEFISMIEAFKYPIVGSQWHPEKNNFEWAKNSDGTPYEAIDHSLPAVLVSQYVADYFVNLARSNSHGFPTEAEEDAALIYNYTPMKTSGDFVQKYYFDNDF